MYTYVTLLFPVFPPPRLLLPSHRPASEEDPFHPTKEDESRGSAISSGIAEVEIVHSPRSSSFCRAEQDRDCVCCERTLLAIPRELAHQFV